MRDMSHQKQRLSARERKRRQRARDREKTFTKVDLLLDSPTRSLLRELAAISFRPEAHCAQFLMRQHLPDAIKAWQRVRALCKTTAAALEASERFASQLAHPGPPIVFKGVSYTHDSVRAALDQRAQLDAWMTKQGLEPAIRRRFLNGLFTDEPKTRENTQVAKG